MASTYKLLAGDCREQIKTLPDNSVDSIVTDPPYELGFMGKAWDSTGIAYDAKLWEQCLRVLKPGGHLLAFGGSRTYHRLACAIEDAGFEIRDQIMWVYGSGFPKSLDVAKAVEGKVTTGSSNKKDFKLLTGEQVDRGNWGIAKQQFVHGQRETNYDETAGETRLGKLKPTTDEAKRWVGWGTALKPAHEPIVVARKPLDGTVADNVLKWNIGGLNIDGCRVVSAESDGHAESQQNEQGRFPANFIHDGSDEVLELFPDSKAGKPREDRGRGGIWSKSDGTPCGPQYGDNGSAARFFYCAKANKKDRNEGAQDGTNTHPTVKPTELMRYLCRLVTPPNGTILDPFTGSGSTGKAAMLEQYEFIGIELQPEYLKIAENRIRHAQNHKTNP